MPRPARHRQALLATAIEKFRRQGYARTGLNEILEASGAPRGSLYHHFPGGKGDLGVQAVRAASEVVTDTLRRIAAKTSSVERFVTTYTEMLAGWLRSSGYRDGCPIATTLLETTPDDEDMARAGRDALVAWIDVCAKVHEDDGWEAGAARVRAEALIAAVEGALLLCRVTRSDAALRSVAETFSASSGGAGGR